MDSTELNSKVELPAETLAILADISQEINASLNLDEVLATAAAQIKRLIDYEVFAVLLPEKNSDQLYFRFAIGHRPEVVEHWRIPMDEGIIGSAAATGQPSPELRRPRCSRSASHRDEGSALSSVTCEELR